MKNTVLSFCLFTLTLTSAFSQQNGKLSVTVDPAPIERVKDGPVVSYADVLDQATPGVVAIYTSQLQSFSPRSSTGNPYLDYYLRRQYGRIPQQQAPNQGGAPARERLVPAGVGSGVIISEDGYIITNHHVVSIRQNQLADEIRVRLSDDREFVAEFIGSDEKTDVAVLKIEADEALPAVKLADTSNLRVGDIVFAIGNPLDVGMTATQGIVSATGRTSFGALGPGGYENFIQTDAAINRGNSGGALVDAWGRLIGINTAIASGTGENLGIGFSIPINMALNVAKNLVELGEVPRGLLGLLPSNLSRSQADAFGLKTTRGALVDEVQSGSPADKGGIQHGDVITQVEAVEIVSAEQLRVVVSQILPGTRVNVSVIRRGKQLQVPVVLGSLDGTMVRSPLPITPEEQVLEGVRLEPITDAIREEFSLVSDVEGVLIREVAFESPHAEALESGMVILEVNGVAVSTVEGVEKQVKPGTNDLYTLFDGAKGFSVIRIK